MPSTVDRLAKRGLITPPGFLACNVHYETMMGSVAYGVAGDASDCDIYGFCTPPKDMLFPHLRGEIPGFGRQVKRFEQYQQHGIVDKDAAKTYDISVYSIVKYFQLCMENNPNMIDSLFVPQRCIVHITQLGQHVREHRHLFLHKGSFHKLKGYAYSQLHKMRTKTPRAGSKRAAAVREHGFDLKFAYHVVRLLSQAEQILEEGDLDLERNREQLKAIRRGEVTCDDIIKWASDKELQLEMLYRDSALRHSPPEDEIKQLLLECLEMHYGSLDQCLVLEDRYKEALRKIGDIIAAQKDL